MRLKSTICFMPAATRTYVATHGRQDPSHRAKTLSINIFCVLGHVMCAISQWCAEVTAQFVVQPVVSESKIRVTHPGHVYTPARFDVHSVHSVCVRFLGVLERFPEGRSMFASLYCKHRSNTSSCDNTIVTTPRPKLYLTASHGRCATAKDALSTLPGGGSGVHRRQDT
jgi:hypothetical protein